MIDRNSHLNQLWMCCRLLALANKMMMTMAWLDSLMVRCWTEWLQGCGFNWQFHWGNNPGQTVRPSQSVGAMPQYGSPADKVTKPKTQNDGGADGRLSTWHLSANAVLP